MKESNGPAEKVQISCDKFGLYLAKILSAFFFFLGLWTIYGLVNEPFEVDTIIAIIGLGLAALAILRFLLFSRHVQMDDSSFYISELWREIRVPFSDIDTIKKDLVINRTRLVRLKTRDSKMFRRIIVLIPNYDTFGNKDAVEELNRIIVRQSEHPIAPSEF